MSWQTKLQILLARCVNGLTMKLRLHADNLYKYWNLFQKLPDKCLRKFNHLVVIMINTRIIYVLMSRARNFWSGKHKL